QAAVCARALALTARLPGIEAASPHPQQSAQGRDRIVGLLRLDEAEPHLLSLAKKAVAFFRISTSIRRRSLSLRSLAGSPSSAVVRPVFSSALTIPSHERSTLGRTPISRAIWLRRFPLECRRRTASRLNSLANFLRAMGPPHTGSFLPFRG